MNDEYIQPLGGCPSRLSASEIECLYCSATILRMTKHRTCAACAAYWVQAFGEDWFNEPWHQKLWADHIKVFGFDGRNSTCPLPDDLATVDIPDVPPTDAWRPRAEFHTVFLAIKDILIVARAAGNIEFLDQIRGQVGAKELALFLKTMPTKAIGKKKMYELLIARGFRAFSDQPGALRLPSLDTIEKYIRRAREEITEYFPHVSESIDILPMNFCPLADKNEEPATEDQAQFAKEQLDPITCIN